MPNTAIIKKNLYFPEDMIEEMKKEAKRLDRSLSWVMIRAWLIAKTRIRNFPSYPLIFRKLQEDIEERIA